MFRQFLEIIREILDRLLTIDPNYPPESIIISGVGVFNPKVGGYTGVVINTPDNLRAIELSEYRNVKDSKEAALDAIYLGLNTVMASYPSNAFSIQIESDNAMAIWMLKHPSIKREAHIQRKMDFILYLTEQVTKGVVFTCRKKNSTPPALKRAKHLATSGLSRHS